MIYNDFKMSIPPPAGTGTPAFQRDDPTSDLLGVA
jgi:hypothetical protein